MKPENKTKTGITKDKFIYSLTVPFIYLLSSLPLTVLYLVSDALFPVFFYLIRYRKEVVLENLRRSFPDKSSKEIDFIARAYYRHFCDLIVETIKLTTLSQRELVRRCALTNSDWVENMEAQEKSYIILMGHIGNWEWTGLSFSTLSKTELNAVYKPIKNPYFDQFWKRLRTRLGGKVIAMKDTYRTMLKNRDLFTSTAFISDQTPRLKHAGWYRFLNQDTAFYQGGEILARKLNLPVVYPDIRKVKRGVYTITLVPICDHPQELEPGEITRIYVEKLEQSILEAPALWLWSHKRWKHKRVEEPLLN